MAATKIRIQITTIMAMDGAHITSPEDWKFSITIKRASDNSTVNLIDPTVLNEYKNNDACYAFNLEQDYDLTGKDTQFEINMQGTSNTTPPKDLGVIKATILCPILHNYNLSLPSSKNAFVVGITLNMTAQTSSWSGGVTTIVQNPDSTTKNTVLNQMAAIAAHICPVIPVPWAVGIPPLPRGVQHLVASPQENLGINPGTTALNALVNPAVIPVLDPTDPDFPNKWARIRVTQYWPADLDTDKFIWRAATSNVKFWQGGAAKAEVKGGLEVAAYGELSGDADEPATVTLHWDGDGTPKLATFRAWVGKPKYVWTRANIIMQAGGTPVVPIQNPTTTADNITDQIAYNNIILWQAGVQMVLDDDETAYDGAILQQRGIFEITKQDNYTFNVALDDNIVAPLLNSRDGVFSVAYLHSCAGSPTLNGAATDRRTSAAEGTVDLDGAPSTSWVRPTGVFPDDDAVKVTMKRMGPSKARTIAAQLQMGDKSIGTICGCIMTQQGATLPGTLTLAHELGHVLGLHHRGNGGGQTIDSYDGVNHLAGPLKGRGHPWHENLLTYGPNTRRQDLDIIQAKCMRTHALLKSDPPPPPPKEIQAIPDANLPTADDKLLLQQYLTGKTPGLKHGPYDIGTTGPDGDGVDGVIGPKTKAAIKQYQTDHGDLVADGIYGPKTHDAFDAEINGTT